MGGTLLRGRMYGFESFQIWVDVQLVHPTMAVRAQATLLLDKIALPF